MRNKDQSVQTGTLKEIASNFLRIGALAYGGPAIMGIMQNELQEKRQWVTKERFMEGLSLVNILPGAGATQLGIFLGYARGGWWGGLVAGLCFMLPAFFIMLTLALVYSVFGSTSFMRSALYGLGPVVLGIYIVAVYRLGRNVIGSLAQILIAIAAGTAVVMTPLGIAMALLLAGSIGIIIYHSKKVGFYVTAFIVSTFILFHWTLMQQTGAEAIPSASSAELSTLGVVFLKIGALTFGGGLTVIAFAQEQVVNQYHWLTHQEFIDGLALGQFTPGPILMIAAYVGFKTTGLVGAIVCALAIFLPSFIFMLSILPVFDRLRDFRWMKAAMKGVGPATIGVLFVSLSQLAPHAVPDYFAAIILLGTLFAMFIWRIGLVKLILSGTFLGVLHDKVTLLAFGKA